MTKKIITALMASLLLFPIAANAALKNQTTSTPALAILDTGFDTSLPEFKGKIIQEACVLEWNSCPNNQYVMEGPGTSVIPSKFINSNGMDHGTQMAYAAITTNPNMNLVLVRIIGLTPTGSRQIANEKTILNALNWVIANKEKYNIQAISLAQTSHTLLTGTNYCLKTPLTEGLIKSLVSLNTPLFASAGNDRDYARVNWPSCIPDAVSVGATMPGDSIAPYSNADSKLLDFYALGSMTVKTAGGKQINTAGTSISAQVAAATWVAYKYKNINMSYQDVYNIFKITSIPVTGRSTSGNLIDSFGLING